MPTMIVDLQPLALVHKALGDTVRLRILQLLPRTPGDCSENFNVNGLSKKLGIPQPTVSHHLKILRQAGVIRFIKKCNSVYYYLDVKHIRTAYRSLATVLQR
jgi:ArsR family transcriptional regulator, arsenate/arsenite/antimonite-responsive transcriptional repressor